MSDQPASYYGASGVFGSIPFRSYQKTRAILDRGIERFPDSSLLYEARATLRQIQGDDAGAMDDLILATRLSGRLATTDENVTAYPIVAGGTRADDAVFEWASNSGTRKSYETYLETLPNGIHELVVRGRLELLDYATARSADTIGAYSKYIETYPSGARKEDADRRIAQLQELAVRAAYEQALNSGSPVMLSSFLKTYPEYKERHVIERELSKWSLQESRAPILIEYSKFGWKGPWSGEEVYSDYIRKSNQGFTFAARVKGGTITAAIYVIEAGERLPNYDSDLVAGRIHIRPR